MNGHLRPTVLTVLAAAALVGMLAQPACARQDVVRDAFAAYLAGDYDAAIAGLRGLARAADADARTHRTLVAALLEVGRYADAEAAARDAAARPGLDAEMATSLGQALLALGRRAEAEQSFRRAVDADASDARTARLALAQLRLERGERAAALDAFDAFIDIYNDAESLSARDLIAVGDAVRQLGVRDPQLFHDAVKAYDEAIKADDGRIDGPPAGIEARLRLGELFLAKYQSTEAQALFREVLAVNARQPRALLGMARAKSFDGSDESLSFIEQSLEVNGESIPARVFHAQLLMELERYDEARREVERALAVDPASLEALSAQAAIAELTGDTRAFADIEQRVLAINPRYADLYNTIAELSVRQRRYKRAVTLATQAVTLDSTSSWGWGIRGVNELRNGQIGPARASLEISFAGDPFNPWIKNTLDLLDTFDEYRTVTTEGFEFMLHESEADLLAPYITALADEAYTALSTRYRWTPDTRVRIEVYPRHADFSVRTVGLAGLGALGVAFGNILSMDSPFARDRGTFNWGTTLWHELAHTFTLGVTDFRVPRWLTEGLSVLEERRARSGWGDDVLVEWLAAWERGDILPVSRLNEGFVRPSYPAQVAFSYFQASLVAQMIEDENGFDAILAMLHGYRDGRAEADIFRAVLRTDMAAFDERFEKWVETRYARQLAAIDAPEPRPGARGGLPEPPRAVEPPPGDFLAQLGRGQMLLEEGRAEEARPYFERARTLVPEYVGPGNPYRALATIHQAAGRMRDAAAQLQALTAINENAYDANVELATLLVSAGDIAGAAQALERAIWISPYDPALHQALAGHYTTLGDRQGVVRARTAIVALDPVDRADALYQLALAHFEAGDNAAARRVVLRALEVAPNFEKAQQLLLRLRGSGGGADDGRPS